MAQHAALLERQLVGVLGGLQPLALERPDAAVPAQHGVDVARRAQRLGALVPLHGVPEPVVGRRADGVLASEERAGLALVDQAAVVRALVLVGQLDDVGARFARRVTGATRAELIGERQDQAAQRVLVVGSDREHVLADALGLRRIIEQPIALGLVHRVRDAVGRDLLELEGAHDSTIARNPTAAAGPRRSARGDASGLGVARGGGGRGRRRRLAGLLRARPWARAG